MAGKNIYIEKMLAEVSEDLHETIDALNRIYAISGLRESVAYTAAAGNLIDQVVSRDDLFGFAKSGTSGNVVESAKNGFGLSNSTAISWTLEISKTLSFDADSIRLTYMFPYGSESFPGTTGKIYIAGAEKHNMTVDFNTDHTVDIDVSGRSSAAFKIKLESTTVNGDYVKLEVKNMQFIKGGKIVGYLAPRNDQYSSPVGDIRQYGQVLETAVVLKSPTVVAPVVEWDIINFMVRDPDMCEMQLLTPSGMIANIPKSGEKMRVTDSTFYTRVVLKRETGASPANSLSTVAYRYMK